MNFQQQVDYLIEQRIQIPVMETTKLGSYAASTHKTTRIPVGEILYRVLHEKEILESRMARMIETLQWFGKYGYQTAYWSNPDVQKKFNEFEEKCGIELEVKYPPACTRLLKVVLERN